MTSWALESMVVDQARKIDPHPWNNRLANTDKPPNNRVVKCDRGLVCFLSPPPADTNGRAQGLAVMYNVRYKLLPWA